MPVNSMSQYTAAKGELREILGDRYVSDDPAIIASYSWVTANGNIMSTKQLYDTRPVAVTLPSTTEEVQAIVKVCRRHGLMFQASSTGHSSFATVHYNNVIGIDLRRMNHMEIDADNQMAIIEPYVTCQTLQAEAMRVGLTTHIVGAGWTHSPLASATSVWGIGISGNHTGTNQRNLLGWELVTPEGEIVRVGSCGSGDGWFAGEGPGPGLRGMLRGSAGALSGLGVFTRIGYKLHPWNGPPELEHKGPHPQIGVGLTDTMRFYHPVWKNWEGVTKAAYDLLKSSASTFIVRMPPDSIALTLTRTNQEFIEMVEADLLPPIAREENNHSWTLLTVSETPAEAQWRERVIHSIVDSTGGRMLDVDSEHVEVMSRNILTSCYIPRVYRLSPRTTLSSYGVYESFSHIPEIIPKTKKMMAPYKGKYKALEKGSEEEFWIWSNEGRQVWAENIIACDSDTGKSLADGLAFLLETIDDNQENPRGVEAFAVGPSVDLYHRNHNADQWMYKVKKTFDPEDMADGYYPNTKRTLVGAMWPLFTKIFKIFPLLRRLILRIGFVK
ncbi:MAG: FAD-binding oxidoreductase [Candidatus Thiodiazotropha sp.]